MPPSAARLPTVFFGNAKARAEVRRALALGFRGLDTGTMYEGLDGLGPVLEELGIPREDVTVVTKVWTREAYPASGIEAAIRESLRRMQVDHVDYLLVHWPCCSLPDHQFAKGPNDPALRDPFADGHIHAIWREMERLVLDLNIVKHLGVSNFSLVQLNELLEAPGLRVKPTLLQTEVHPLFRTPDVLDLARAAGMRVMAYSPMAFVATALEGKAGPSELEHVLPRYGDALRALGAQLKGADAAALGGVAVVAWIARQLDAVPIVRSRRDDVLRLHLDAVKRGSGAIVSDAVVADAQVRFAKLWQDGARWKPRASRWAHLRFAFGQTFRYMFDATALRSCRGAPGAVPVRISSSGEDDEGVRPEAYPDTMLRATTANAGCLRAAAEALRHTRRVYYVHASDGLKKRADRMRAASGPTKLNVVNEKSGAWRHAATDPLALAIARHVLGGAVELVRAEAAVVRGDAASQAPPPADDAAEPVLRAVYNLGPGDASSLAPGVLALELGRRAAPWHKGWGSEGVAKLVCFEYVRRRELTSVPRSFAARSAASFLRLTATERALTGNRYVDEACGVIVHPSLESDLLLRRRKQPLPLTMRPLQKTRRSRNVPFIVRLLARHCVVRPGDGVALSWSSAPALACTCARARLHSVSSAFFASLSAFAFALFFAVRLAVFRRVRGGAWPALARL